MKVKFYGKGYEIEAEGTLEEIEIEEIIKLKKIFDQNTQHQPTNIYYYTCRCICSPCRCNWYWIPYVDKTGTCSTTNYTVDSIQCNSIKCKTI